MKPLVSIILVLGIFLQIFSKVIIIVNYEVNKDFIVKVLCINKEKPQVHCNGKCYLKKEIDKDDRNQNSASNNIKEKNENIFFRKLSNFKFTDDEQVIKVNSLYLFKDFVTPTFSIFHPPKA